MGTLLWLLAFFVADDDSSQLAVLDSVHILQRA